MSERKRRQRMLATALVASVLVVASLASGCATKLTPEQRVAKIDAAIEQPEPVHVYQATPAEAERAAQLRRVAWADGCEDCPSAIRDLAAWQTLELAEAGHPEAAYALYEHRNLMLALSPWTVLCEMAMDRASLPNTSEYKGLNIVPTDPDKRLTNRAARWLGEGRSMSCGELVQVRHQAFAQAVRGGHPQALREMVRHRHKPPLLQPERNKPLLDAYRIVWNQAEAGNAAAKVLLCSLYWNIRHQGRYEACLHDTASYVALSTDAETRRSYSSQCLSAGSWRARGGDTAVALLWYARAYRFGDERNRTTALARIAMFGGTLDSVEAY